MTAPPLTAASGARYGAMALPLAFAALPLYVQLPHHYAQLGVPLGLLGVVLLAARAFDAVTDPWLGRWWDRVLARAGPAGALRRAAVLAGVLALTLGALWQPPQGPAGLLAAWALVGLLLTTLTYSALTIVHQSWGARLGGDAARQARLFGWREGFALGGVVLASVLPSWAGWGATWGVLVAALVAGLLAWRSAPRPGWTHGLAPGLGMAPAGWLIPWRRPAFRRLAAVFGLSTLASAIPATLLPFFVADRLQANEWQGPLLALYFVTAAAGLPLWLRLVRRMGAAPAWGVGMVLAVAAFGWTAILGTGDVAGFAVVCALSGLALGADLALPPALLAGLVARCGDQGRHEGAYFGWWNLLAKAMLAMAAGVALPLLQRLGYQAGSPTAAGLQALTLAYAVVPCMVKLMAAALLAVLVLRRDDAAAASPTPRVTDPNPTPRPR